jgi:hypothetical protein
MNDNKKPAGTGDPFEQTIEPVYTHGAEDPDTVADKSTHATLPDPRQQIERALATNQPPQESEKLRDQLVQMTKAAGCELFHDRNNRTYISMVVDGHKENWRLNSEGFKRWLRHQWHNQTNTGISSSAVTDAVETLDANATYEGTAVDVHIRIAHHAGDIFVDLCDEKWRAVRITPAGWNIIDSPPVRFVRTKGMLPLSMPTRGGSIDELRPLINAPTDEIWCLIVAWILAAFSPGPFPILLLLGEQGSAKSFLCRVLRRLIDPSEVEITTSPKDARDVIMAAQNSHVLALDNLSGIKEWLSDLLCSIATGAAHRERRYHTNNGDEELFRAKLPIVLNGIDFRVRDDLLSRAFLVTLPVIADKAVRTRQNCLV